MVMRRGHHTSRVLEALGDVESQKSAVALPMVDGLPEEEETDGFPSDSDLPQQKT
jgi:radical SAM superfamily enzyme